MHGDADFARQFRARPLRFILPMKQSCSDTFVEYEFTTILELCQNNVVDEKPVNREVNSELIASGLDIDKLLDEAEQRNGPMRNDHESVLRKKPIAQRLADDRIHVKPELLCDIGCETPRINTDSCLGKEYRYFYAISCDLDLDNPGSVSSFPPSSYTLCKIKLCPLKGCISFAENSRLCF